MPLPSDEVTPPVTKMYFADLVPVAAMMKTSLVVTGYKSTEKKNEEWEKIRSFLNGWSQSADCALVKLGTYALLFIYIEHEWGTPLSKLTPLSYFLCSRFRLRALRLIHLKSIHRLL